MRHAKHALAVAVHLLLAVPRAWKTRPLHPDYTFLRLGGLSVRAKSVRVRRDSIVARTIG